ncbi:hypothetical protein ACLMJK_009175 [Lecanora helva]
MTTPTFEQVVSKIFERSRPWAFQPGSAYEAAVERNYNEAKDRFSCLHGKTIDDVYAFQTYLDRMENYSTRSAAPPRSSVLWNAVMQVDALASFGSPSQHSKADELFFLLASNQFPLIPLGLLYGETQCWLEVDDNSLVKYGKVWRHPNGEYERAKTHSQAITYPDGHPSEGSIALAGDESEEKLRRFFSLGYVLTGPPTATYKTGHVLVIDLEPGRNLNPWIVLASKYPCDTGISVGELVSIPPEVTRDEPDTDEGVLPGDKNRTPVGKVRAMNPTNAPREPIVRLFSPDFKFTVVRTGSDRGYRRSSWGPSLPSIMDWYYDPPTGHEVCFTNQGQEYMTFNPATRKISYAKSALQSYEGEVGVHGEIVGPSEFVTLEQRLATVGSASEPQIRRREVSSSSGF